MPIRPAQEMVAEASEVVTTIPAEDAARMIGTAGVSFIDLREPAEIEQSGKIAGAIAVPRGLLEFKADPSSPLHNPAIDEDAELVLYCGTGGRSALAAKTLLGMGFEKVQHVAGGFPALKQAGANVEGGVEKKSDGENPFIAP